MERPLDRRRFLRLAGTSLGIGALFTVAPELALGQEGSRLSRVLDRLNGEPPATFSFVQLSDTHVGFQGPPAPLGTEAFEGAVRMINRLAPHPDLVIVTGDLTHDTEDPGLHAKRMELFKQIAGRLGAAKLVSVPGENDAALDGGALYREHFGETYYSFDHRGVHFVALDNVSRGRPEVGAEQLAWLKRDLARFPSTAPIIVFTHRPLFDLRPDWEWFTSDGAEVMSTLAPYENVTVLYGHIHRQHGHQIGGIKHYAARSLIFAFPDPADSGAKKPLPFDKAAPFKNLGVRFVQDNAPVGIDDVELTMREFSGTVGANQILKDGAEND